MEMLWFPKTVYVGGFASAGPNLELTFGLSVRASDMAFTMKEVKETLVPYFFSAEPFNCFWSLIMVVRSISSPRAMTGILRASFMDLTMPLPTLSVISTTVSSPGLIAGRDGAAAAAADGAVASFGAAAGAPSAAAKTSDSKTRPAAPEPVTLFKFTPLSFAKCRTFGVASTPGAFTPAPGADAAGAAAGVAAGVGTGTATGSGSATGAGVGGAGAAAAPLLV
mmetsp:Transcript_59347/g.150332  ORF Transcript_59347/g.150332 Transcript_59347/m.150332 type:complete len:223 (-) Transcript_59347:521-1189(-)